MPRSELAPLFDRIVVKELKPEQMRQSGIVVPVHSLERYPPQEGIVIAAGPGLSWWPSVGMEMPVKPGDHVMFPYDSGAYIELNEEKLLVMNVGQLLGVVRDGA